MANLFESPRYIAVEGPIRVGKSTLLRILAERLNAQRVMEPEANPFLDSFYEGERGAAFQAQFTFLVRRFEQLQALDLGPSSQKVVVSDFIFEKDKLFACLNLTDHETLGVSGKQQPHNSEPGFRSHCGEHISIFGHLLTIDSRFCPGHISILAEI